MEDNTINSVVFFKSYYESIVLMPKDSQIEIYNAIFDYSFNGTIPEDMSNDVKSVFLLMKPNIDSSIKRYKASIENGKKGGRPKKKTQEEPKKTQDKPNKNLNKNKEYNKEYDKDINKNRLNNLYDN